MVLCRRCGSELPEDTDFCVACSSMVEPIETTEEPVQYTSLTGKVTALLAEGKYDEALGACQQALHTDPTDADALVCLGDICRAQSDFSRAAQAYRQALKCQPADPDAVRARLDAALDGQVNAAPAPPPAGEHPKQEGLTVRSTYASAEQREDQPVQVSPIRKMLFSPWGLVVIIALTLVIGAISYAGITNARRPLFRPSKGAEPIPVGVETIPAVNVPVPGSTTPAPRGTEPGVPAPPRKAVEPGSGSTTPR